MQMRLFDAFTIGKEAMLNASLYLSEARLLLERGSVGHATAFAVLGYEEAGKSLYFLMVGVGAFPQKTSAAKKMFADHRTKQILGRTLIAMHSLFTDSRLPDLAQRIADNPDREGDDDAIRRITMQAADTITKGGGKCDPIISSLQAYCDGGSRDNAVKMMGLYVDWNDSESRISTPSDVTQEECLSQIRILEQALEGLDPLNLLIRSEDELQKLQDFIAPAIEKMRAQTN